MPLIANNEVAGPPLSLVQSAGLVGMLQPWVKYEL